MPKKLLLVTLLLGYLVLGSQVKASECENIDPSKSSDSVRLQQCQDELSKTLDQIAKANTTNSNELRGLQNQVAKLQAQIKILDNQLERLSSEIFDKEVGLGVRKELLAKRIAEDYKDKKDFSILSLLFSGDGAKDFLKGLILREKITGQDKDLIHAVLLEIDLLNKQKERLKIQQKSLDIFKKEVNKQASFLAGEVAKANKYVSDLSGKISALSARQNEILAARSGNFIASVGDSELSDDYNASIRGFREAAPDGSFAVFSFGAYTHRKGMSQYGARGRAQGGQSYRDVLKAYYGKDPVAKDTNGTINVAGYGALDFETTYLWGIAEMPSSWHPEALKAQAIAARSYAYRYKIEGKQICTTEACQVFRKSKSDNPPNEWKQAVIDTRGQVIEGVVTYYSSTTGGYITTMGWDTIDGGGGSNFFDKTYERQGGSPWAYKAWYRKGYSPSGDTCGRANPWLSSEEMADIINAALYRDERVTPVTTSCWGGNPYSHSELRGKANGPSSVSSVQVIQGNGTTNEVVFQTDKGEIRLGGADFKTAFNLRAPGRLQVPQSGYAFFNIEKK